MALALLDGKVLRFDRQQRVKGDSNGVGEVKNLFFGRERERERDKLLLFGACFIYFKV